MLKDAATHLAMEALLHVSPDVASVLNWAMLALLEVQADDCLLRPSHFEAASLVCVCVCVYTRVYTYTQMYTRVVSLASLAFSDCLSGDRESKRVSERASECVCV